MSGNSLNARRESKDSYQGKAILIHFTMHGGGKGRGRRRVKSMGLWSRTHSQAMREALLIEFMTEVHEPKTL